MEWKRGCRGNDIPSNCASVKALRAMLTLERRTSKRRASVLSIVDRFPCGVKDNSHEIARKKNASFQKIWYYRCLIEQVEYFTWTRALRGRDTVHKSRALRGRSIWVIPMYHWQLWGQNTPSGSYRPPVNPAPRLMVRKLSEGHRHAPHLLANSLEGVGMKRLQQGDRSQRAPVDTLRAYWLGLFAF
jgi:hypothetical protein